MNLWILLLLLLAIDISQAEEIEKISLPLIHDLQRADIYVLKLTKHPAAILILSPGFNGNGKDWIQDPVWQAFAREHNLGLVGLSFASDGELLRKGQGYYYPAQGSGQLLLDGIKRVFDSGVPLLLYGFSGGAHFTSGFVEWKPEQVVGWCACSAEWWDKPSSGSYSPPGLIVCGDEDERYGASLTFFKQGRSLGKPWLWISISKNRHSISLPVEGFIRHYFATLLDANGSTKAGQWVDIDFKRTAEQDTLRNQPSLTGWLPDSNLLPNWQSVHYP
jgi:hypothetical protein